MFSDLINDFTIPSIANILTILSFSGNCLQFYFSKKTKDKIVKEKKKLNSVYKLPEINHSLQVPIKRLNNLISELKDSNFFHELSGINQDLQKVSSSLENRIQIILDKTPEDMNSPLNSAIHYHEKQEYKVAKNYYFRHLDEYFIKEKLSKTEEADLLFCCESYLECCFFLWKKTAIKRHMKQMEKQGISLKYSPKQLNGVFYIDWVCFCYQFEYIKTKILLFIFSNKKKNE